MSNMGGSTTEPDAQGPPTDSGGSPAVSPSETDDAPDSSAAPDTISHAGRGPGPYTCIDGTCADAAADSSPPDSAPASAPPDSTPDAGDCAEIPTAPNVVLRADVKLTLAIPASLEQATQMPHKFTLANDDNSYSRTLSLASDAGAGDTGGTSFLIFTDMTESHTYTLQCDDGTSSPYIVFQNVDYDTMIDTLGAADTTPPTSQDAPDNGSPNAVA
jgi:hypothetical protein